jgi:UDP:flavonoid glycosyltransferase YjiC (YdhE family)
VKILALVNAHALAHVSRPLEIAKVLRDRGHSVAFAGLGKYLEAAGHENFPTIELPFVSIEQILDAVRSQKLHKLYIKNQLASYIEAELTLYQDYRPDLLMIDNRLTACTSAELASIRTVSILNVHMSLHKAIPFYSIRNVVGANPSMLIGVIDQIEKKFESFFYDALVMRGINRLRKEHGLQRRYSYALEEGDVTLFPDIPEFSPVSSVPSNAHYVGPLTWHNDLPMPKVVEKLDRSKKCIYFTIGSAGLDEWIEQMHIFQDHDFQVVIASGDSSHSTHTELPENVFLEAFVNADKLLPHCDLVVCHGGNGKIYQALGHGLPIVGVATHEEQNYGLKRVKQLGLGRGFHVRELKKRGLPLLMDTIYTVLGDDTFRHNARQFQDILSQWHGAEKAAEYIEGTVAPSHPG